MGEGEKNVLSCPANLRQSAQSADNFRLPTLSQRANPGGGASGQGAAQMGLPPVAGQALRLAVGTRHASVSVGILLPTLYVGPHRTRVACIGWLEVSSPALMTNNLTATASTPPETPAEQALPVRQRATAAETRLTPRRVGTAFHPDVDAVQRHHRLHHHRATRPAVDARVRDRHRPVRLDCGRLCFRGGALQLFGRVLSGSF